MAAEMTPCPKCSRKFDLSRYAPGKKVRCPKCGGIFTVPESEPELIEEEEDDLELELIEEDTEEAKESAPAKAAAATGPARARAGKPVPRTAAAPGRSKLPPATSGKKGLSPKVLGGIAAGVLVIAVGGYLAFSPHKGSGSPTPAPTTPTPTPAPATVAAVPKPAEPEGSNSERIDYLKRADDADTAKAHLEVASWCSARGMKEEMRRELERARVYEPKNKEVNERLGNKLYNPSEEFLTSPGHDGELNAFVGRWITPEEQATVAKLEDAIKTRNKEQADREAADPWYKEAITRVRNIKSDAVLRDFKLTATIQKPYLVFVEGDDVNEAKQVGEFLASNLCDEQVYFAKRFEGMLSNTDKPQVFLFVLFANRKGFDTYNEKNKNVGGHITKPPGPEVLAFYHPASHLVIAYREPGKDVGLLTGQTYSTTFHEGVHQLRAFYTLNGPDRYDSWTFWWSEGIAEYIAPEWDEQAAKSHQHKFESVRKHRVLEFKMALSQNKYVPLWDLLARVDQGSVQDYLQDRYKFQPDQREQQMAQYVSLFYAESWSFLHFLNNYENGKYRNVFQLYCKAEFEGQGDRRKLAELLGFESKSDWEDIQNRWIAYVKCL